MRLEARSMPLPTAAFPEPDVRLLRGAVYRMLDGSRPLELDLWLPAAAARPAPVLVFVHGGGWRFGLRDDPGPRFRDWQPGPFARLVRAGFAVACPDYRLSGEVTHPGQAEDLAAALSWLAGRAGELGVDSGRTVVWGESAGGHLAALTALTQPVAGCVTWYAPTDLTRFAEDHGGRFDPEDPATFEARLLGGPPARLPGQARAASPALQVEAGAPPFLILHGTADTAVPVAQSDRLAAALRDCGTETTQRYVEGAGHLWSGVSDAVVESVFDETLAFALGRVG